MGYWSFRNLTVDGDPRVCETCPSHGDRHTHKEESSHPWLGLAVNLDVEPSQLAYYGLGKPVVAIHDIWKVFRSSALGPCDRSPIVFLRERLGLCSQLSSNLVEPGDSSPPAEVPTPSRKGLQ